MKKILLVIMSIMLVTGCSMGKGDTLKNFRDYNSKKDTYHMTGEMSIVSNEDKFTYNVDVSVMDNDYYKVKLINTINNHEQVILKNDDGVFVITPNLNKSFKFQSEWPNNSSQSYLIGSLLNDINNDSETTITEKEDEYVIESKVNYPNNSNLISEIITVDKEYNIKNASVLDSNGNEVIFVKFSSIDYKPNLSKDDFKVDGLIDTTAEEDTCSEDACKTDTTSNILDEIIYPLYIPTDTYLSSKDTVSTDEGNRVILTFAGVDPFILVEEVSVRNDELEVIPVSGEPLMLGESVGALTDNSLYWTSNGIDYYLTSKNLESSEMKKIAESITNSSSLVASTK